MSLKDVRLVEVGSEVGNGVAAGSAPANVPGLSGLWAGLEQLRAGTVDAVYVKGASAVEAAKNVGAVVGIDTDALADRTHRVNNGTPRPITVHRHLLENHFDLVVRFLHQTLRASEWAKDHLSEVRGFLEGETVAGAEGVAEAYRNGYHLSLHPSLDAERVELFRQQKELLLVHGFLERDFELEQSNDERPLKAAWERLSGSSLAAQ